MPLLISIDLMSFKGIPFLISLSFNKTDCMSEKNHTFSFNSSWGMVSVSLTIILFLFSFVF